MTYFSTREHKALDARFADFFAKESTVEKRFLGLAGQVEPIEAEQCLQWSKNMLIAPALLCSLCFLVLSFVFCIPSPFGMR